MRRITLVLLVICGASSAAAQSYLPLRVRSCAYADSLMGPVKDEGRADILGVYDGDRDTTFLVTESRTNRRPRITTSIKFAGKRPTRAPLTQLIAYLRGQDAKTALSLAGPPAVTLRLDDSVAIGVATVAFGRFEGPGTGVSIPLSALVPAPDLLSMAQAKTIVLDAEVVKIEFTAEERRSLRAVTRVALCPG